MGELIVDRNEERECEATWPRLDEIVDQVVREEFDRKRREEEARRELARYHLD